MRRSYRGMDEALIFDYLDYRVFMKNWIDKQPSGGRGEKARLARAFRGHSAYFSAVLSSRADLNFEQGFLVARAMRLTEFEIEYFVLLIEIARAQNPDHKKHLEQKRKRIQAEQRDLKKRLKFDNILDETKTATYFSEWYHATIHLMIATLPEKLTSEKIAKWLHIPRATLEDSLSFLESAGLIQKENGSYQRGTVNLHLGSDSPFLQSHHRNWRLKTIQSLDQKSPENLHYTSVVTLDAVDIEKMRTLLVNSIEKARTIVDQSDQISQVGVLCVDWFTL